MTINNKRYNNCEILIKNGLTKEEIVNKIKNFCSRNKQYWLERGYSEEDSIKMARSKMPGTFEYFFIFKKYSKEEAENLSVEANKKRAVTLKNLTEKYGEEDGKRRFDVYRNKQAYSNTLEYCINKYGEEKGIEKYYSANEKRAVTKINLIKKHGEEIGIQMWDGYVKKQTYVGKKLEYFVEKYGEEVGKEKYKKLGILKSRSFESFIMKCDGDVILANKLYNDYCNNFKRKGNSIISQELFDSLKNILLENGRNNFYYDSHNKEWCVCFKNKGTVFIDFFDRDSGKIIEFYGDYWHCNPMLYEKNEIVNMPGYLNITADFIWERDKKRLELIKTLPYVKDIMVVWEKDYRENKKKIVDNCISFLL